MNNSTVESPCINICRLDEITGLCSGCYRTIDEIVAWPQFSDHEKIFVLDTVEKRKSFNLLDKSSNSENSD